MNNVGRLDQRIEIWTDTEVADDVGGFELSPVLFASVWANVIDKSGGEKKDFDRVNASAVTVFVIRFNSDVKESMRIDYLGEKYNIRYIRPRNARSLYTTIEAERGVATNDGSYP